MGTLYLGCRDKDMDHVHATIQAGIDVLFFRPCKAAARGFKTESCNRLYRPVLCLGRRGKPGFNGMDTNGGELPRYLEFLIKRKGQARGLFTIAKRGIENSNVLVRTAIDKEDNSPQGTFVMS